MSKKTLALGAIMLLGLVVRLLYFAENAASPDFDSPNLDAAYHDYWARGYLTGDWTPPNIPADPQFLTSPYFRPPGYPYFLASIYGLLGTDYKIPRIVQIILGLGGIVLAYYLGEKVFGGVAGLVSAFGTAFYWVFIYSEGELLEPTLMCVLMLVLLHSMRLWRGASQLWKGALCGLIFGWMALVRPNLLLCLIPVGIWLLLECERHYRLFLKNLSVFLLGCAAVITPVTIRNYIKATDLVLISSNAGINLYIGNHEGADGFSASTDAIGGWDCFYYPRIISQYERELGRPLKPSQMSAYFARLAVGQMTAHPVATLKLWAKKALLFWGPLEVGNEKEDECERSASRVLSRIPIRFPLVFSLFVLGTAIFVQSARKTKSLAKPAQNRPDQTVVHQKRFVYLTLMLIAFYFASYLPFFVAGRYRTPIVPCMLLLVGYGVDRWIGEVRRRSRDAYFWLVVGLVLFALASVNFAGYEPREANWHVNRAAAYARKEDLPAAQREAEEAVRINPLQPVAHKILGDIAAVNNATNRAIVHYAIAVTRNTNDDSSLNNLAWLLIGTGTNDEKRTAQAVACARRACELTGFSNTSYLDTLAECYWRTGERRLAVDILSKAMALQPPQSDTDAVRTMRAKLHARQREIGTAPREE